MIIPEHIREKLDRLYSNRYLGAEEIGHLESWLAQAKNDQQTEAWLSDNWEMSGNLEVDISFEEIRNRIKKYGQKSKMLWIRHWFGLIQKAAAILLLPLLILSVWLMLNRQNPSTVMTLATAKGEHTHVFLPDGSEVWLNVDSKLEYHTDYNENNRLLKLKGEAFFKVAKGKKYPFIVNASNFQVKAVGTEFNISAYDDEPSATTFLKEGVVELRYFPENSEEQMLQMTPGEEATISKKEKSVHISPVGSENPARWTDGELYFDNEPFDQVFRKMERWFNVKIQYNVNEFTNETLTVNLKKGESIQRLFQIIDQAIGIKVKQNGDEYIINRK
ncbi:MAG: FecR domain-containing protein [Prolixibacteraceae bacterium]|jgi:ferric-dicitrate binding protein FerR (iron transport regulator)